MHNDAVKCIALHVLGYQAEPTAIQTHYVWEREQGKRESLRERESLTEAHRARERESVSQILEIVERQPNKESFWSPVVFISKDRYVDIEVI